MGNNKNTTVISASGHNYIGVAVTCLHGLMNLNSLPFYIKHINGEKIELCWRYNKTSCKINILITNV